MDLSIILYLSIALIAIAFTILVIYLSRTLRSVQNTLDNVATTIESLEKQLNGVTTETTELIHRTNKLADDFQHKSESLNKVVYSVTEIGDTIQHFNQSIRKVTNQIGESAESNGEKVSQVVQWSNVAIDIWSKWKIRKQSVNNLTEENISK